MKQLVNHVYHSLTNNYKLYDKYADAFEKIVPELALHKTFDAETSDMSFVEEAGALICNST